MNINFSMSTHTVIHFEDYGKVLDRGSEILVLIDEHIRLRHHLFKISHGFHIYLLLLFFEVTASQFVTLLRTTGTVEPSLSQNNIFYLIFLIYSSGKCSYVLAD